MIISSNAVVGAAARLGVRREILQRSNAVLPRQMPLELGLEDLEAVPVEVAWSELGNVEARRMWHVNDECVRQNLELVPGHNIHMYNDTYKVTLWNCPQLVEEIFKKTSKARQVATRDNQNS